MKKPTILLLLILSITGCQWTSSKIKNQELPIWGEWHGLTVTPAGDTVIYDYAEASHRSLIADSKSQTVLIDLGQEEIKFDIKNIKEVDGEFVLTLKFSKSYSNDTTSSTFSYKPVSSTQAIWSFGGFTELFTSAPEHYTTIEERYISPQEAINMIENREELSDHYIFDFNKDSIFDIGDKKSTLLKLACDKENEYAVEKLIHRGCDVNKRDDGEKTPLMAATDNKRIGIMQLLIDAGADVNAIATEGGISTALIFACHNGHLKAAQMLIDAGATVNSAAEIEGVMTYSVLSGNTELTKLMSEVVKSVWLQGKDQ